MSNFTIGETYPFEVLSIQEASDEKKYICLSDGERDTYRVAPFDFQLEWERNNLPKTLSCYVTALNIWGLPTLAQVKKEVLASCYTEPHSEYAFKVVAIREDAATKKLYYELKDPFGIKHRYYPDTTEPTREVSDIFSLLFVGIEDKGKNKAHLVLKSVEVILEPAQTNTLAQVLVFDPRAESKFGYESETKEFKSTIVYPAGDTKPDIDKQMLYIAKTIAGFQNKNGGDLYIGVNDSGVIVGVNHDFPYLNSSKEDVFTYHENIDGYENKIRTSIRRLLGSTANSNISFLFQKEDKLDYCQISIKKVLKPIFLNESKLYQRAGNMTQLLKGDEISWFIEERFQERNQLHFVAKHQSVDAEEVEQEPIEPAKPIEVLPVASEPIVSTAKKDKVWYYLTFYKTGEWSFQDNAVANDQVAYELPIMDSLKKERMMIVYENGCVNAVCIYEIINPKSRKGRSLKTKGKRYSNGWNTESAIKHVFCVGKKDLIAFRSVQRDGIEWVKIHQVSAITEHGSLPLKGNIIITPNLEASIVSSIPISVTHYHLLSSLILKDYQTSGYLGFKTTERNYQKTIKLLDELQY